MKRLSLDRGFHSPANQVALTDLMEEPCLAAKGRAGLEQQANATLSWRETRRRHPGIEAVISGLQRGQGLKRCRDRSGIGFDRYVGLAILGRNLMVLGRILVQQSHPESVATKEYRQVV